MKFNLGFLCLYNLIILSLEIAYFEYYYFFPLLKEILNYRGYTLKSNSLKNLTQQTVINTSQLIKWVFFFNIFFNKYYNKIYFKFLFFKNLKKRNLKCKNYFQLEKKNYKKNKYNQYIYNNKIKDLSKILLFFSNYFQKKIKNKIRFKKKKTIYFFNEINQLPKKDFFYFLFKSVLAYKKWKADELYIKMAYIAYCKNLMNFSIALFKMARFEKQTFFYFYFKNVN